MLQAVKQHPTVARCGQMLSICAMSMVNVNPQTESGIRVPVQRCRSLGIMQMKKVEEAEGKEEEERTGWDEIWQHGSHKQEYFLL